MTDKDDDPATAAAFLVTLDSIREAIKDLQGWDACLALTICLSECIVYGNSEDDDPDEALRLAHTIRVLGDITTDKIAGDDDGDDDGNDTPRPSPPSANLLRKFLGHRRATKNGRLVNTPSSGNTNRVVSIVGHDLDDFVSSSFASSSIIHRMYSAVRMGRLVDGS